MGKVLIYTFRWNWKAGGGGVLQFKHYFKKGRCREFFFTKEYSYQCDDSDFKNCFFQKKFLFFLENLENFKKIMSDHQINIDLYVNATNKAILLCWCCVWTPWDIPQVVPHRLSLNPTCCPSLIFSKTFSILRKPLPGHSKKIVHWLFCVFQTKSNKAVNIFCRLPQWIRNVQMIPAFSTIKTWMRILNG